MKGAMWRRFGKKLARIEVTHGMSRATVTVLTRACAGGPGLGPRFIIAGSLTDRGRFRRVTFDMGEADVREMARGQGEVFSMLYTALDAHLMDEAKRWLKALRASRRKS